MKMTWSHCINLIIKFMEHIGLEVVMRAGSLTVGVDRRVNSSCELVAVGWLSLNG